MFRKSNKGECMKVLLISLVLLLGFTGCGRKKSNPTAKTTEAKVTEAESAVQEIESSIQKTEEKLQLAEQQLQENPQSEEIQRELTELREALTKTKERLIKAQEELAEAQKEREEAQKPVACARDIEESKYPCSKVCADIRKVHDTFQRYFYCMESNNYAHNSGAKSCWDTYRAEIYQAGGLEGLPLVSSLSSFSQAENMSFALNVDNYMQLYHEISPDYFRQIMEGSLFSYDGNTRRGLCPDFDDSSVTGEEFLKCAKKIMQYYVDENNRRLKCW